MSLDMSILTLYEERKKSRNTCLDRTINTSRILQPSCGC